MPSLSEPCFVALEILKLSETQTVIVFSGNLLETLFPEEPKPHSCIPPPHSQPCSSYSAYLQRSTAICHMLTAGTALRMPPRD